MSGLRTARRCLLLGEAWGGLRWHEVRWTVDALSLRCYGVEAKVGVAFMTYDTCSLLAGSVQMRSLRTRRLCSKYYYHGARVQRYVAQGSCE